MKLCFWSNEMVCSSIDEYDVRLEGHEWHDAPEDYSKDKIYRLTAGQVEEVPVVEYDPSRLRVHRVLPMSQDPLISDFTILGFRKIAPYYDRGIKYKAEYKCADKDELIVEKIFTDIRDPVTGRLTDLQILFNYYCEDGTVGLSKTELAKSYNKAQAETEERKRRERSLDFLISEARHTPLEPIMNAIINHYHDEQLLYKEKGSSEFADALNSETDPTISSYLSIKVPFTADPLNYEVPIKEATLYQLRAIDEATLLTFVTPIGV